MIEMIVEELQRDRLQRPTRRRDLRQHVDAVDVLVDHPLQPPHLTLDAAQPGEYRFRVSLHQLKLSEDALRG